MTPAEITITLQACAVLALGLALGVIVDGAIVGFLGARRLRAELSCIDRRSDDTESLVDD